MSIEYYNNIKKSFLVKKKILLVKKDRFTLEVQHLKSP